MNKAILTVIFTIIYVGISYVAYKFFGDVGVSIAIFMIPFTMLIVAKKFNTGDKKL